MRAVSELRGRRRPSTRTVWRAAVLGLALATIVVLLVQARPDRSGPAHTAGPLTSAVSVALATPVVSAGVLTDGAPYQPRLYLDPDTSVGVAASPDGTVSRLVLRSGRGERELRRLPAAQQPQYVAVVVAGDTVLWVEATTQATELWRASVSSSAAPVMLTSKVGSFVGYGGQFDLVPHDGAVSWAARASENPPVTDIYTIGLDGRGLTRRSLGGDFVLSAWPRVVTPRALGVSVHVVSLDQSAPAMAPVAVSGTQEATCSPTWCRVDTVAAATVVQIELEHPDGSARTRLAGSEATPTIADATLQDRYVPLTVDATVGASLEIFDAVAGHATIVATGVDNVAGSGAFVWWSTGTGDTLRWCVVDVRTLPS
jgi:hypothetical protein